MAKGDWDLVLPKTPGGWLGAIVVVFLAGIAITTIARKVPAVADLARVGERI